MVTDEELAALEERLAEAEAEVDRLQTTAADREARAAHLEQLSAAQAETLAQTKAELASRDDQLAAAQAGLAAACSETEELRAGLRSAAEKYRQAVLATRTEVPPDLVSGEPGVGTTFGLLIEPQLDSAACYSIWAGATYAGTPRLRLDEGTPGANQTMLWLAEGTTPTLRRVQWKTFSALVPTDRVMILV